MKKYIVMSVITAFVVSNLTAGETAPQTEETKATTSADYEARIEKLEKSLKNLKKQLTAVKAHDSQDNIKFSADLRTAVDRLEYKTASGKTYKNTSLFSNRLWLNMAYAPSERMIFRGQLSYNKAYGASPKMVGGLNQRGSSHSYDVFDWVTNETLTNDTLKVKEAYWLYMNDTFLGTDVPWTASFGRRPSVNGFLISLRDDDQPSSPDGHLINMEFDGGSFKFKLDKVTGVSGMYWKVCVGRGLTNARARFNMDAAMDNDPTNDFHSLGDYSKDSTTLDDIDLAGFIFVPYDDGQYKVVTTYYRAFNLPGFVMADPAMMDPNAQNTGMMAMYDTDGNNIPDTIGVNRNVQLKNLGNMDGAAISVLVDGIGDGINDFLDDTKFFASFAWSKSMPDNTYNTLDVNQLMGMVQQGVQQSLSGMTTPPTQADISAAQKQAMENIMMQLQADPQAAASFIKKEGMMGSNDDETGTSYWVGVNMPAVVTDDGRIGLEFNHGSKYWRPFTYGEDTLVGSKIAVRGDAYEVYYIQPLLKGFSAEIRYTKLNYDYTGSQGFFGATGVPMTMEEAKAFGMDPIEEAEDIRLSLRYRF